MNDCIAQALTELFDRHRLVFWYDTLLGPYLKDATAITVANRLQQFRPCKAFEVTFIGSAESENSR